MLFLLEWGENQLRISNPGPAQMDMRFIDLNLFQINKQLIACQESLPAFVDECFDYLADKMRVQPAANYINPLNTLAVMNWTTSPRNTQKKSF